MAERPFFRKVFQMTNTQRFKNFQKWDRQIKKHPNNKIIFQNWLKALIEETKEVAQ